MRTNMHRVVVVVVYAVLLLFNENPTSSPEVQSSIEMGSVAGDLVGEFSFSFRLGKKSDVRRTY